MLLTQPHAGEIKSAEFHLYQLILAAGESARVELQADKAQLSLALLSTNNELIAATSESNAPGVQRLDIVAEDATTYLLRVTIERSQSTTAQYRLTLQDKHAATAVDRERFALHQLDTEIARLYQQRKTPALQQAAAKGREAGSRWLALNEWSRAGAVLSLTGQCYRLLDDFLHARQALTEALALQRRVGERQASVDTITELGLLHAHSGEYQEALDCFDEAYQLARATGFTEGVLASLDLLGVTCKYIGDFDKGRAVYQQLLDQAGKLPDRARTQYETQALIGLGIVARAKREYPLATDYLSRALEKTRQLGDPLTAANALANLGIARRRQGEWAQALKHLEPALVQFQALGARRGEAEVRYELACTYAGLGRSAEARAAFNQALALMRTLGMGRERALLHKDFAQFEAQAGNLRAALAQLEQALPITDAQSAQLLDPDLRALFNGSRHHYYDDYVELLMRLRAAEQAEEFAATAFYASERTHARTLLGLLSERALGLLDSSETSLAARARELEQQIAARTDNEAQPPGGELALLMAEYNEVRAQIRQRNPHYAALIQSEPLTLAEVQRQVLNADTLLLEYYLGVKHSYLFVVSPTALHSFVLPPRAELEQAAHELRALLDAFSHPPAFHSIPVKQRWQQEQTRAQQDAATRLGHLLLAPAQALLRGQRLLIVPDGALHVVPFAALPVAARPLPVVSDHAKRNKSRTTNNRQLTTDNQQPLLARHEIITLPSASTLAVLRREALHRQPAPKTLAVFADPVFDQQDERVRTVVERQNAPQLTLPRYDESAITRQGLVRLPATRNEAQAIAALVPPAERRLALGFDASRAAALGAALHPYRYVHFATHGLLNNAQPELSGLVLSQVDAAGHTQNGLLRTLDIFNLKLNADLVVLSGCQTALGREVNGEGLIGMTRGFLYAGARRVIASLWQVNDAATAELMRRFYQGLWGEQKLAPAAALRAAQLQLRCNQRWQSPYYWAAFTLQGEW